MSHQAETASRKGATGGSAHGPAGNARCAALNLRHVLRIPHLGFISAFVVALILLLASPAFARDIDIVNLGVPEHRVARVRAQVEPAFEHVEARTGLRDDGRIALTLVAGFNRFAEIAAHDGVGMNAESVLGYAQPGLRRVVLNFSAIDERELEPLGVLRHEIAHLVLGSALPAARPLWFEEGLANYVENVALNALREGSQVPLLPADFESLDDLSAALRDQRAGEAYPESRRVVQLIVTTWGETGLKKLIAELREPGTDFGAAFKTATGAELAELERRWQEQRKAESGTRIFVWLGANWWWLLFAGAAVLMAAGLWVRRKRARKQIEQWEEQEKLFPSDPGWSYTPADEGDGPGDDDGVSAGR